MAKRGYRGSILFEILIVLLALLLIAVITVPDKIWKEENALTAQCRYNMNSIFEAERFLFRKADHYTTNLDSLAEFVAQDSTLLTRQKLVKLSNELNDVLVNVMGLPTVKQMLIISKSVNEIEGDLRTSDRYFRKYPELQDTKEQISFELKRLEHSGDFPVFNHAKIFVDSLSDLKEHLNEYTLQKAAFYSQHLIDSLQTNLSDLEKEQVGQFWKEEYVKIANFARAINKTDIKFTSSVADRLKKFIDRINTAMKRLQTADLSADVQNLGTEKSQFETVYQKFLEPENFMITQRYGLLNLSDVDSILTNFNSNNFIAPDSKEPYVVNLVGGVHLTIECPELLKENQEQMLAETEPVRNLAIFSDMDRIDAVLDTTINLLTAEKGLYRRHTNLLLDLKEIQAEMKDIKSVRSYRYVSEVRQLLDTLAVDAKLSTLKPELEKALNPMDTLATRIENRDFGDLESKLQYYGQKIQQLDSSIAATRLPARVRRQISKYYPTYQQVFDVMNQLKNGINPEDGEKLRTAARQLEKTLLATLNGKKETVYVIFSKKHKNHGYIKDAVKSWEEK